MVRSWMFLGYIETAAKQNQAGKVAHLVLIDGKLFPTFPLLRGILINAFVFLNVKHLDSCQPSA